VAVVTPFVQVGTYPTRNFARHVFFRDLDQVGDQIMSPFQLNIDLSEGISKTIPQLYEAIVLTNRKNQHYQYCADNE
jgi:hypothetical protein